MFLSRLPTMVLALAINTHLTALHCRQRADLFSVCDALKDLINESQVMQLNLADALVDVAVG